MSAQFLQSSTPSEFHSIKVNDCTIRGGCTVAENFTCAASVDAQTLRAQYITYDQIPSANIVQATDINTAIDATAVANPYNFTVTSQTATTAAGGTERFFLNLPTGILSSQAKAEVYAYYYSGVVGTAGIPCLSIIVGDTPNNRVDLILENKHAANALNGVIHFRFSLSLGALA
tara:strand:- start:669 stop:1190 length:522 start_codon:yes stop_codon:yes gene_type:complete